MMQEVTRTRVIHVTYTYGVPWEVVWEICYAFQYFRHLPPCVLFVTLIIIVLKNTCMEYGFYLYSSDFI